MKHILITYNKQKFDFKSGQIYSIEFFQNKMLLNGEFVFDLGLRIMVYINSGLSCLWVSRIREPIDLIEIKVKFPILFKDTIVKISNNE